MPRTRTAGGQLCSKMNPSGRYYIRLIPIHSGGQENDVRRHKGLPEGGKRVCSSLALRGYRVNAPWMNDEPWGRGSTACFISASFYRVNRPSAPFLRIRIGFRVDPGPVASLELRLDCVVDGYGSLLPSRLGNDSGSWSGCVNLKDNYDPDESKRSWCVITQRGIWF